MRKPNQHLSLMSCSYTSGMGHTKYRYHSLERERRERVRPPGMPEPRSPARTSPRLVRPVRWRGHDAPRRFPESVAGFPESGRRGTPGPPCLRRTTWPASAAAAAAPTAVGRHRRHRCCRSRSLRRARPARPARRAQTAGPAPRAWR